MIISLAISKYCLWVARGLQTIQCDLEYVHLDYYAQLLHITLNKRRLRRNSDLKYQLHVVLSFL